MRIRLPRQNLIEINCWVFGDQTLMSVAK